MDLLDDLKKQAEAARQDKTSQEDDARREAKNAKEQGEALKQTYRYLKEMVQALNAAKPEVSVDYEVHGFGTLSGLAQEDYVLDKGETEDGLRTIVVHFQCGAAEESPRQLVVESRDAIQRQREFLWQHNLRYTDKVTADGVGTFFLEPVVYVKLEFIPDLTMGKIKLVLTNFDHLGNTIRRIEPERITRETLDDVAALILRKSTGLEHLTNDQISPEMRQRIQEGLKKEKEDQERHEQQVAAQMAEEERMRQEQRLVNKAKRKIDSLGRRAVGYVKNASRTDGDS